MITCPQCQAQNEVSAAFCDQCGSPLAGAASVGTPPVPMGGGIPQPAKGGGVCPACGAAVLAGEAFCDNCGAALANVSPSIPVSPPIPPVPSPTPTPVTVPPIASATQGTARLIGPNGQTFTLSGKSLYIVGREDAVSGVYPDVDTTPSGGLEDGVSRRHAQIENSGSQWFIQDLNAANGTAVDNQKLAPGQRQPLRAGVQIRLGKWVAVFQI